MKLQLTNDAGVSFALSNELTIEYKRELEELTTAKEIEKRLKTHRKYSYPTQLRFDGKYKMVFELWDNYKDNHGCHYLIINKNGNED